MDNKKEIDKENQKFLDELYNDFSNKKHLVQYIRRLEHYARIITNKPDINRNELKRYLQINSPKSSGRKENQYLKIKKRQDAVQQLRDEGDILELAIINSFQSESQYKRDKKKLKELEEKRMRKLKKLWVMIKKEH